MPCKSRSDKYVVTRIRKGKEKEMIIEKIRKNKGHKENENRKVEEMGNQVDKSSR